jgi:16S rRNA (cytosine1402-N4)-methyltransferase
VPGGAGATGGRAAPHAPVMLDEVLAALAPRPDGFYVDATFGRGGHARAILARLGERGALLAIDRDPEAVRRRGAMLAASRARRSCTRPFRASARPSTTAGRLADGILLDLGVSSPQLDDAARGFSFLRDGPLDMRMDPLAGEARRRGWRASAKRDMRVIFEFGEDRFARRIARAIVAARELAPITTTGSWPRDRAAPCRPASRASIRPRGPSRRCASRSTASSRNSRLRCRRPSSRLAPGGRLAVISFHSLEDRQVKRFMRRQSHDDPAWAGHAAGAGAGPRAAALVGKAVFPSAAEVERNPRARSAVLRAAERLAA